VHQVEHVGPDEDAQEDLHHHDRDPETPRDIRDDRREHGQHRDDDERLQVGFHARRLPRRGGRLHARPCCAFP
jgi:hypothetical protein